MLETTGSLGLEFAPNTNERCKRVVESMHTPTNLLAAYKAGRAACKTGDLVLAISDQVGHIEYMTRPAYIEHLKSVFGAAGAAAFTLSSESAHKHMKLPAESDAMWLVVSVQGMDLPLACVLYSTHYMMH